MARAQTSFEFLFLLGFMLLVFLGFFAVAETFLDSQNRARQVDQLEQVARSVEREFTVASRVTRGYQRTFAVPPAEGVTVEVLDDTELLVSTSLQEYIIFLPFEVFVDGTGVLGETNVIMTNESGIFVFPN